ncbi:MAG: PorV/PorQ family protein [Melioribacter sp.]|nr:PorV/PorQ family protein [Melioribacter sp.]
MIRKIFLLVLIFYSLLPAQGNGNSGVAFLKLGSGSRNIAMGDLGTVSGNELNAVNYNPSILSILNKTQLTFSHNSLIQDLRSELFGGSFNAFGIPLAVMINTTSISDIEIRNIPGEAVSKFNANYFSAGLSGAIELLNNFHTGFTLKYLYENLYSDEASGYALDFGITYTGIAEGFTVGASLRNMGLMNKLRNEATKLPKDFRLGASYSLNFSDMKFIINLLGGFQKFLDVDDSHLHFGTEVNYDNFFFIRGGFITGYETKSVTTGFGIKLKSFNMDYAYVPFKYGLGDNHIITFIFTFND